LVSKGGTWYLLAGAEAGLRTFRLSRVRAAVATGEAVHRPDDFDLAEAWDAVQSELPSRLAGEGVTVEFRVEPNTVRLVAAVLARWAPLMERPGDGGPAAWLHRAAIFPSPEIAAAELVRFGRQIEVTSPPEVRAAMARLGADLVAVYGRP
jgi:predicted DNA-binding transcriptional regulator YafY